jgi:hypothetical protein
VAPSASWIVGSGQQTASARVLSKSPPNDCWNTWVSMLAPSTPPSNFVVVVTTCTDPSACGVTAVDSSQRTLSAMQAPPGSSPSGVGSTTLQRTGPRAPCGSSGFFGKWASSSNRVASQNVRWASLGTAFDRARTSTYCVPSGPTARGPSLIPDSVLTSHTAPKPLVIGGGGGSVRMSVNVVWLQHTVRSVNVAASGAIAVWRRSGTK